MDTTATATATTDTAARSTSAIRPAAWTDRPRGSAPRRHAAVTLVLAVLTSLALLVAGPAGAWTTTSSQGVPVQPTVYAVQGSHYNSGSSITGPMYKPWLYQSGPVVYRVSGSDAQTVRVVYRVDRWNGSSWAERNTAQGSTTIASGVTSAKAPNLSILPSDGSGYYRVRMDLTWTNQIGAYLGSTSLVMSSSRDYVCSTTRTCSIGAGYVYLGA